MQKRGEKLPSGGAAASVIGVITIMLIFYIIFLPPADRYELLFGDNETDENGDPIDEVSGKTLLLANIGKLDYQADASFDHTVPNVYLVETKNAQAIETFTPFIVRNGWFSGSSKELEFTLAQPELTSNAKLVFDAPVRKGILTVTLNDHLIYEGRADALNVAPIPLKVEQLRATNTLTFGVSGVGLAFWRTNEYDITNAQIIADITDVEKQESANIVTLEPSEARNLERATLTFFPICTQDQVGALHITINNREISSSSPDCESVNRIELDPVDLSAGRNSIVFKIERGNYRIEQIKVKTELKDAPSFVDYFELNATSFDDVVDGDKDLLLRISFVDDGENKRAELNVNGKKDFIDQKSASYERDISAFAIKGNNYIELVPKSVLNIAKLEVVLE